MWKEGCFVVVRDNILLYCREKVDSERCCLEVFIFDVGLFEGRLSVEGVNDVVFNMHSVRVI